MTRPRIPEGTFDNMLISHDAMRGMDSLASAFKSMLLRRAIERAYDGGRETVTRDDVLAVAKDVADKAIADFR